MKYNIRWFITVIISMLKKGCRVGFFGIGKSNISLLSHLPLENCRISIRSDREIELGNIPAGVKVDRILCGGDACRDLDEDIIFFSPSVKRDRTELVKAKERGVIFSSDAELFFDENQAPVYAVTGSDGKSTTATLAHLLLKAEGVRCGLIGNVGEPMAKHLHSGEDCFVCELSSFMLEYASPRAKAACITNITPNHLDWHGSFENYKKIKLSVAKKAERVIIFDEISEISTPYGIVSTSRDYRALSAVYPAEIYITQECGFICKNGHRLIKASDIRRREEHNIKNLMMAIGLTDGVVGKDAIFKVASEFSGLRHRCELFFSQNGVNYIDSSIDSTPARTAQTLRSLDRPVIIILGGRGKGLDYAELIPALQRYAERAIIVGENAEEIYGVIRNFVKAEIISRFDMAVVRGNELAKNVGTLLLSPASTSYDLFRNFEERGDRFREILLQIHKNEN